MSKENVYEEPIKIMDMGLNNQFIVEPIVCIVDVNKTLTEAPTQQIDNLKSDEEDKPTPPIPLSKGVDLVLRDNPEGDGSEDKPTPPNPLDNNTNLVNYILVGVGTTLVITITYYFYNYLI